MCFVSLARLDVVWAMYNSSFSHTLFKVRHKGISKKYIWSETPIGRVVFYFSFSQAQFLTIAFPQSFFFYFIQQLKSALQLRLGRSYNVICGERIRWHKETNKENLYRWAERSKNVGSNEKPEENVADAMTESHTIPSI